MSKLSEKHILNSPTAPKFFKALGDVNRLEILKNLCCATGPQSVKETAGCCCVDFSVVSRHLSTLKDAGILSSEKNGKEVRYSVEFESLAKTLRELADYLESCEVKSSKCRKEKA